MKNYPLLLLLFAALIAPGVEPAAFAAGEKEINPVALDSVTITQQSAFWAATTAGSDHPDRMQIRLNIRYELAGSDRATVSLAINDKGDLDFSTFNSTSVTPGRGEIELKAGLRMFERDTLRCVVRLTKPNAAPGEKPLAVTSIEIDLKQLRATRRHIAR